MKHINKFLGFLSIVPIALTSTAVFSNSFQWAKPDETGDVTNISFKIENMNFSNTTSSTTPSKQYNQVGFHWNSQSHNTFTADGLNFEFLMQQKNADSTYRNWTKQEILEWANSGSTKTLDEVCPQGMRKTIRDECAKSINCMNKDNNGNYSTYKTDGINIKNKNNEQNYKFTINPDYSDTNTTYGFKSFFNDSFWENVIGSDNYYSQPAYQSGYKLTDSASFQDFKTTVVNNEENYNKWCFTKFCTQQAKATNSYITITNICFFLNPKKISIKPIVDKTNNKLSLKIWQTSNPWTVFINSYLIKNITSTPFYSKQISWDPSNSEGFSIVSLELLDPKKGIKVGDEYTHICRGWTQKNTTLDQITTNSNVTLGPLTGGTTTYYSWLFKDSDKTDTGSKCGNMSQIKEINFTKALTDKIYNPLDE